MTVASGTWTMIILLLCTMTYVEYRPTKNAGFAVKWSVNFILQKFEVERETF